MRSDLKKKLNSFTLETSKNNLIRNFLRNGRVRVNPTLFNLHILHEPTYGKITAAQR